MRIFDRKFLQYQLAFGVWYNLKTRYLFLVMVFAVITFFTENFMYLAIIPTLYLYGYIRLIYLLNAGDEKLNRRMEKQYKYYNNKTEKSKGKYAFQLERNLFAIEMNKKSVITAIEDIKEILRQRPKMESTANGVLLSIYLVGQEEGSISKIPEHLINHLDSALLKEENPNALLDYVRMALKVEKYDLAIKLLDKAEDKSKIYKRQRLPVLRSIYKTAQVSIPYYKAIAYGKSGEKEQSREQLDRAIKYSQSNKLKKQMKLTGEELGIS